MNKRIILLTGIIICCLFISCDEPKEEDTTPPTITLTTPQTNTKVNEICIITCISTDNKGVEKVELWVDGSPTDITDNTEPYILEWNTNLYEDKSYTITIRSYDLNGNVKDSDPIILIVDNSLSLPTESNITSIVFENGGLFIKWNKSIDGDFSLYSLNKSLQSDFGTNEEIFTSNDINDTLFFDSNINPLIYQYYRVTVSDTFSYKTNSDIVSSSLDPIPKNVDVTSVTYDLTKMYVNWNESLDTDFKEYKLWYALSEQGDKSLIGTYGEKTTVSWDTTDYDPTRENWYWVEVFDTLGQSVIGIGKTNAIDSNPLPSDILLIKEKNNEFHIVWTKNTENDFSSYQLWESLDSNMLGPVTKVYETFSNTDTSYIVSNISSNEKRYYQIDVRDVFGLATVGNILSGNTYPKIVYMTYIGGADGGNHEIGIMDGEGRNQVRLTNNSVNDYYPMFSPDGCKIVFNSGGSIYLMDIDGSNLTELASDDTYYLFKPRFTPDGLQIVYLTYLEADQSRSIRLMNSDGSNQTKITTENQSPDWVSLNENLILFVSSHDGNREIYKMNYDGTNQTRLTNNLANDSYPRFTPDGLNIVFASSRDGNWNVYIMDIDGGNQTNLTNSTKNNFSPQPTPDGQNIMFESGKDGKWGLYMMDIDGSNEMRLTSNSSDIYSPQISKDGSEIIFSMQSTNGRVDIFKTDIDGSNLINLTNTPDQDENHPQFQPRP